MKTENDTKCFLELENISFKYAEVGSSRKNVLNNVSLKLGTRECVAIVGPSGSGKTTLIQHFTGLLKPTSGRVLFQNQDIWARRFDKSELRRKIGIVFQFPETQLFEETVEKDIAFGPKNLGVAAEDIAKRIEESMRAVDLSADFKKRSPFRLSEGEKRRAAIAGVLAMRPEMIVFDEPTAGLDPRGVQGFSHIIRKQVQTRAIVVVTHNMDFVADVADRVIALHKGMIVFDGTPRELFSDPQHVADIDLEVPMLTHILQQRSDIPEALKQEISLQALKRKLADKFAQFPKV